MEERRRHKRYSTAYKVVYSTAEEPHRKMTARSIDISLGGVGIKIKELIKGSGKLIIQIHGPILREPVKAKGDLVWQKCQPALDTARAGVRFTDVPYTALKTLLGENPCPTVLQRVFRRA